MTAMSGEKARADQVTGKGSKMNDDNTRDRAEIGPISWPLLLIKLFDWQWLARRLQPPYPTAWDYYFRKRQPCFVIARLKDGKALAGYWGRDSYATFFPNDGELYLQAVYRLNSDGTFGEPIADTRGALIRRDSYVILEFFEVPSDTKAVTDVQERQPESPTN